MYASFRFASFYLHLRMRVSFLFEILFCRATAMGQGIYGKKVNNLCTYCANTFQAKMPTFRNKCLIQLRSFGKIECVSHFQLFLDSTVCRIMPSGLWNFVSVSILISLGDFRSLLRFTAKRKCY